MGVDFEKAFRHALRVIFVYQDIGDEITAFRICSDLFGNLYVSGVAVCEIAFRRCSWKD